MHAYMSFQSTNGWDVSTNIALKSCSWMDKKDQQTADWCVCSVAETRRCICRERCLLHSLSLDMADNRTKKVLLLSALALVGCGRRRKEAFTNPSLSIHWLNQSQSKTPCSQIPYSYYEWRCVTLCIFSCELLITRSTWLCLKRSSSAEALWYVRLGYK